MPNNSSEHIAIQIGESVELEFINIIDSKDVISVKLKKESSIYLTTNSLILGIVFKLHNNPPPPRHENVIYAC